jgi:hypothetical protein
MLISNIYKQPREPKKKKVKNSAKKRKKSRENHLNPKMISISCPICLKQLQLKNEKFKKFYACLTSKCNFTLSETKFNQAINIRKKALEVNKKIVAKKNADIPEEDRICSPLKRCKYCDSLIKWKQKKGKWIAMEPDGRKEHKIKCKEIRKQKMKELFQKNIDQQNIKAMKNIL